MATTETYTPTPPPRQLSPEARRYLEEELKRISELVTELLERIETLEGP